MPLSEIWGSKRRLIFYYLPLLGVLYTEASKHFNIDVYRNIRTIASAIRLSELEQPEVLKFQLSFGHVSLHLWLCVKIFWLGLRLSASHSVSVVVMARLSFLRSSCWPSDVQFVVLADVSYPVRCHSVHVVISFFSHFYLSVYALIC